MAFKNIIVMYTRQGKMDSIKETAAIQTSKENILMENIICLTKQKINLIE